MFRELLLVAVGRRDTLSAAPSEADWRTIYDAARQQGLLGVLWDAACSLPEEQRPRGELAERWRGKAEMIAIVHDVRRAQCRELTEWVRERGETAIVLKGEGYARFYPVPARRNFGDIDLWVPAARERVLSLFGEEFRVHDVLWQECKVEFFDNDDVDVHFWPVRMYNPLLRRRFCRFCSGEAERGSLFDGFRVPSLSFDAVYCIAHIFRHVIDGGVGLRQMMDCNYILQSLSAEERNEAASQLGRLGLRRIAGDVMYVLGDVFALERADMLCEPSERGGAALEQEIFRGGNFGWFAPGASKAASGRLSEAARRTRRTLKFSLRYPREALWVPIYKLWHFLWRKAKGFENKHT